MRKVQPHQAGIIARIIIDLRIKPNASYWACFLTVLSDVCKKESFGILQAFIFLYLGAKNLFQPTHLQIIDVTTLVNITKIKKRDF